MPKEKIKVTHYEGLAGGFDPADIPNGAGIFVNGLGFSVAPGRFKGLDSDNRSGLHGNYGRAGVVNFNNSQEAIGYDANGSRFIIFDGLDRGETASFSFATTAPNNGTFRGGVSDGFAAYIPLGQGVTPQHIADFGSGYDANSAILDPPSTVTMVPAFGGTPVTGQATDPGPVYPFKKNTSYLYAVSYIYDGTQESPLYIDTADFVLVADDAWQENVSVPITRPGSKPNTRITHICLYRASTGISRDIKEGFESEEHPDTPGGPLDPVPFTHVTVTVNQKSLGDFTLVAIIEWADAAWSANVYTVTDTYKIGPSFRNRTGFADTLEHMNISWELSVLMDGFHIIAGAQIEEGTEEDGLMEFQLLRSKYRLYSTFDWSTDFYALPTKPVAMVVFQNRLWCFDVGRCYVLTSALGTHKEIEGVGCESFKSIVATERGMIVCSSRQIWFHDRRELRPIGFPVLEFTDTGGTEVGYLARQSDAPVCVYDSRYNLFIVAYRIGTNNIHLLFYDPELDRWSHGVLANTYATVFGGFTSSTGMAFIFATDRMIRLFDNDTTRACDFISKDFENDPYLTTFYEISVRGNKPSLWWSEDGATEFSVTLTTDTYGVHRGDINSSPRSGAGTEWKKTTKGRFRLAMAADDVIDNIAVVHRTMKTPAVV